MRFFETILSGAALIVAVAAQLEINDYPTGGVQAGETYTITYSPKDNTPTTFILRQGPSGNLNTIETITTTATGGSFSWTVPEDLTDESDYALEIQQGSQINYSGQFPVSGGSGAAISSAVSSMMASASSSAAYAASSASAALSSAISSAVASITAAPSASASASILPSVGLNSTVSTATLSRTSGSSPSATTATIPESTGAASSLAGSPLAAIFGAVAAFAYLA